MTSFKKIWNSTIFRNCLVAFLLWLSSIAMRANNILGGELLLVWGIVLPFSILHYTFSFRFLIPRAYKTRRPDWCYLLYVLLELLITAVPVGLLISLYIYGEGDYTGYTVANMLLQLCILSPISWYFYKRHYKQHEEVLTLQKELGQSTAGLDFLRSQINPHFLFNALNAIYGTAIQEQAERTSEAVQKLGDMMRFMMHENMQAFISLTREIDYLSNYISLQRLRTNSSDMVRLETEIQNTALPVRIAPMLLIPFVENAFKHGISFRQPSFIRIVLEVKNNGLNFDVYNTRHPKPDDDPEKNANGIGLNNVRQRLQLLYPNKHELIIRETGKEFFVHLTIELS
ncbi:MAG: histidine kinase [Williamsia sp.]|nr:histidine kinase [Williamsia sp.]